MTEVENVSLEELNDIYDSVENLGGNKEYLIYAFSRKAEEYAVSSIGLSLEILKDIIEKIYRSEAIELFCLQDCAIETHETRLWDLIDEFWEYVVNDLALQMNDLSIVDKEIMIREIVKNLQTLNKFTASYDEVISEYQRLRTETNFLEEV
jgi:hypothetical protein